MTFTAIVILRAAKDLLFAFCGIAGSILLAGALCAAASAQTKSMWADPAKTLRSAFPVAETGFDPQAASDLYSNHVERAIFDWLYVFDYLSRPYKLVPSAAAALPEIVDGGRTWTENTSVAPLVRGYKKAHLSRARVEVLRRRFRRITTTK